VVHRNAPLTETGRLRLARCVAGDGWPLRQAAERFQVSPTTAARWAARYRQHGAAGMADRSSRPHTSPARTPARPAHRPGPSGGSSACGCGGGWARPRSPGGWA
jgi:transposase-like protein